MPELLTGVHIVTVVLSPSSGPCVSSLSYLLTDFAHIPIFGQDCPPSSQWETTDWETLCHCIQPSRTNAGPALFLGLWVCGMPEAHSGKGTHCLNGLHQPQGTGQGTTRTHRPIWTEQRGRAAWERGWENYLQWKQSPGDLWGSGASRKVKLKCKQVMPKCEGVELGWSCHKKQW